MGLTGLLFITIYGIGCLLTFYNPVFGMMTYIFEWHNHPPYFWWGDSLPDLRWSFTIAFLTMLSWALNRSKIAPIHEPEMKPIFWLFLFVANAYLVSIFSAVNPERSMDKAGELMNVFINFFLMVQLIRSHDNYRRIIWVMIVGVAHFGFIAWDVGGNRDIGVIAPNATEENAISAHVVTVLPFFGIYFLMGNRWQKLFLAAAVPFCLNLLILANSRAALLGLAAVGFLSIFLTRGVYRFVVIVGIIATAGVFMYLSNQTFWDRQETTQNYQDDGSAMSRLHIWAGGWEMLQDYPAGVGGGGFVQLSMSYIPEIDAPKSQHNTYVAVATDWGFQGILLYLLLLGHCIVLTLKMKRMAKGHPLLKKYEFEIMGLQLAFAGVCAAGMFHSRQYAEIVYWLCAFTIALHNIMKTEVYLLKQELEDPNGAVAEDETIMMNPIVSR